MTSRLLIALCLILCASNSPAEEVTSYVHQRGESFSSKDLEAVCANKSLRVLDLRGSGTQDGDLVHLAAVTGLEELRLDSHRITSKGYAHLAPLKNLKVLGIEAASANELEGVFEIVKDFPLEELDISGSRDFNGRGLDILNCRSTLRKLDLSCFRGVMDDKGMQFLKGFTALTHLNLSNHTNIRTGISVLEEMTELEELQCYECVGLRDEALTPLFAKLKKLKKLNLGFCWAHKGQGLVLPENVTDLYLVESKQLTDAAFEQLPCKDKLVHVNLFQCLPLSDKGIGAFQNMPQLRSFNVGCIRAMTNRSLETIGTNHGLTNLNISDNDRIDDSGLAHLENLRQLEVLNLWHTKGLVGSGLQHLTNMPMLVELNLADCHNLEGSHLSHIQSLPSLRNLYLNNCRLLDDESIAQFAGKTSLKELTLRGCERLTDGALTHLATLGSLEYLDISNCDLLTDPAVRSLRRALPDCEIVR